MEIDYMAGLVVSCSFVIFVMETITNFYLTAVVKRDKDIKIRTALEQKFLQKEVFPVFEDPRTFAVIAGADENILGQRPEIISQNKPRCCANSMLFRHFKLSDKREGKVLFYQGSRGVLPDDKGKKMAIEKVNQKKEWAEDEKERWYIRQEIQWDTKHAKGLDFKDNHIYIRPIFSSNSKDLKISSGEGYWEFADGGMHNENLIYGNQKWNDIRYSEGKSGSRHILILTQCTIRTLQKSGKAKKIYVGFVKLKDRQRDGG